MEGVKEYIRLGGDTSIASALTVFPAERFFLREPLKVREMLSKVLFYEKEADKVSRNVKRQLFHKSTDLKLSQKIYLWCFVLHIETGSDKPENLADILCILSLKLNV